MLIPPRAALLLLTMGCAHRGPGAPADSLALQAERAEAPGRSQALENLRLASMARARGDEDLAEQALRRAVGPMTTFQGSGEFASRVVAEEKKEWKGEPYEKLAAFTLLGTLLWAEGDRDNALAMYKSAILADTGSAIERYRSDFVPAWVLEGLVFQAEGEEENARQTMGRGIDALWSRHTIDLLGQTLIDLQVPAVNAGDLDRARTVLAAGISAGSTAAPRDPVAAARATVGISADMIKIQREARKRDRLDDLRGFSKGDFKDASRALPAATEAWVKAVEASPRLADPRLAGVAERLEFALEEQPTLVLLLERGAGPRKTREGRWGQILTYQPGSGGNVAPLVEIDGVGVPATWLDDLSWQASTRGGRRVDGYLKGKAVFRDVSLISGQVMFELADDAAYHREGEVAVILAAVGVVFFVSGAIANPAADIRAWEQIPDSYYLVTARLPPGPHRLRIDEREWTAMIPGRGQLVVQLPAAPPADQQILRPRGAADIPAPPAEIPRPVDGPLAIPTNPVE